MVKKVVCDFSKEIEKTLFDEKNKKLVYFTPVKLRIMDINAKSNVGLKFYFKIRRDIISNLDSFLECYPYLKAVFKEHFTTRHKYHYKVNLVDIEDSEGIDSSKYCGFSIEFTVLSNEVDSIVGKPKNNRPNDFEITLKELLSGTSRVHSNKNIFTAIREYSNICPTKEMAERVWEWYVYLLINADITIIVQDRDVTYEKVSNALGTTMRLCNLMDKNVADVVFNIIK